MSNVSVGDGPRIHYTVSGVGAPVLLLAGLGASSEAWMPLIPSLDGDHRCIAVDNRGVGGSGEATGQFSVDDMAEDALAVLDDLELESAHVVGNSLGGIIAQEIALTRPERVRSLTLLASTPGRLSAWCHPACLPDALRILRGSPDAIRAERLVRLLHGPLTLVDHPERLRARWGDTGPELGTGPAARQQLRAAMRWTRVTSLRRLATPTLVVHGSHDRVSPAVNGRLMARLIPGAELVMIQRAGHLILTDACDEVAAALTGFLAATEGAGRSEPSGSARPVWRTVPTALRGLIPHRGWTGAAG